MSSTQKVHPPLTPTEPEASETPSSRLRKEMKSYFDSLPPGLLDQVKDEAVVEKPSRSRSRDKRNRSKSIKGDTPDNTKALDSGKQAHKDHVETSIDRQSSISGTERKRRNTEADLYYKTRICPQFISSFCERGARCTYAHGQSELRERSQNRIRICFRFEQGLCKKVDGQCRYSHVAVGSRSSQRNRRGPEKEVERSRDSTRDREVDRKKPNNVEKNEKRESCDYNRAYEIRNPKSSTLVAPTVSAEKIHALEDSTNRGFSHQNRFANCFVPQISGHYGHPSFVPSSSGYVGPAQHFPIYGQPYYVNYPSYEGQPPAYIEHPQAYFDKMNQQKLEHPPFAAKFEHPPARFDCKQQSQQAVGDQKNVNAPHGYGYPHQPYSIPYGPPVGFANFPMPYYPSYGYDYPAYGGDKCVAENSNGSSSLQRGPIYRSFDPRHDANMKNDKSDANY